MSYQPPATNISRSEESHEVTLVRLEPTGLAVLCPPIRGSAVLNVSQISKQPAGTSPKSPGLQTTE